jgi:adenylosuccinate lyase
MEAVKAGAGREAAHEAIKQHAIALTRELRVGDGEPASLLTRLASDRRIGSRRQR